MRYLKLTYSTGGNKNGIATLTKVWQFPLNIHRTADSANARLGVKQEENQNNNRNIHTMFRAASFIRIEVWE